LQVGEWVIAVGNPFNLTSTVTAGIVSAKGRDINILRSKFPIESFIQTDAAINPGNSGGALVNKSGELIGINTAILSQTGSYAGYGFAVPVDIVKKVVNDIIEYGEVQKAFFGGEVVDFDSELADRLEIDIDPNGEFRGVLLGYVQEDGAARQAGLEEGDIITRIDTDEINSRAEFDEELSYHSPGDEIHVTYERNGEERSTSLTLTNREGTTTILKRDIFNSQVLGADFEAVSKVERDLHDLEYGVKIINIKNGLLKEVGVDEDFIVTEINNYPVKNPERLVEILTNIRGRVIMEGITKSGRRGYYSFFLR
ncbi:MAG: PDZ domain-containing protein, partial [Cyclobacteriaceae bacterium]